MRIVSVFLPFSSIRRGSTWKGTVPCLSLAPCVPGREAAKREASLIFSCVLLSFEGEGVGQVFPLSGEERRGEARPFNSFAWSFRSGKREGWPLAFVFVFLRKATRHVPYLPSVFSHSKEPTRRKLFIAFLFLLDFL